MDYDKKVLRKLQLAQLGILKDIDSFCKKYSIEYILAYGTLLGAVRHKGFIPWDDDIDIQMKREDFNRFVKLAKKEMTDNYDILNMYDTPGFVSSFIKISKKGTIFTEATNTNIKYKQGIFVDVFPLDYCVSDEKRRMKAIRWAWFWEKICVLKEISDPIINIGGNQKSIAVRAKKKIAEIGCKAAHSILVLLRVDKNKSYKKYLRYACQYNKQKKKCDILQDFCSPVPKESWAKIESIFPTKDVLFEGEMFPAPNDADSVLKIRYGDYMTLPPEDKRHNHMAKELVFGDEEIVK